MLIDDCGYVNGTMLLDTFVLVDYGIIPGLVYTYITEKFMNANISLDDHKMGWFTAHNITPPSPEFIYYLEQGWLGFTKDEITETFNISNVQLTKAINKLAKLNVIFIKKIDSIYMIKINKE